MLDAPLLSGVDSPLDDEVERLAQQVQKLAQDAGVPAAGFTQDASAAAFSSSAPAVTAGCAAPPAAAAPTGTAFTQSTSTTSAGFVQDTGAASTTFDAVTVQAPQFVTRYRNLNVLSTGFQTLTQIPAAVACLKQSFQALKAARNPQSAAAAISGLQSNVMGMRQIVRTAFQLPR
jgi:hypothetical protein